MDGNQDTIVGSNKLFAIPFSAWETSGFVIEPKKRHEQNVLKCLKNHKTSIETYISSIKTRHFQMNNKI